MALLLRRPNDGNDSKTMGPRRAQTCFRQRVAITSQVTRDFFRCVNANMHAHHASEKRMDAGPEARAGNRDDHAFCRQRNAARQKRSCIIDAIEHTNGDDGVEGTARCVGKKIRFDDGNIARPGACNSLAQNACHARRSFECRDALHAAGDIESIEAGAGADFENLIRSIEVFRECSKESLLLLLPDAADYRQPQHMFVEPREAAFEEQVIHGARCAIQFQSQSYTMRCSAPSQYQLFFGRTRKGSFARRLVKR